MATTKKKTTKKKATTKKEEVVNLSNLENFLESEKKKNNYVEVI